MFSKGTCLYGVLIIFSSSFTFQIYNFFEIILGKKALMMLIYLILLLAICTVFAYAVKTNPNITQFLFLLLSLLFASFLIIFLPFLGEKTHIISYGLLGYLSIKDTTSKKNNILKALFLAFTFTMVVNILDELFQGWLPYRVGEIRDVITNIFCSFAGFLFYFGLGKNK